MRVIHVTQGLPDMTDNQREIWEIWLKQHNLNPYDIVLDSEIVLDDDNRYIVYESFSRKELAREHVLVQLEAPAMPFLFAEEL